MGRPEQVRVGIIGAGANTRSKHIPGLRALEGVTIAGVRNRTDESTKRVAHELGIPRTYADWRELIEDHDIDAVVIGTWPYMHCPITCAALAAGRHVLCEARMAMNATEAHVMLTAARSHPELIAQVVPAPTTLRVDAMVKRLLAEGYIGEILGIRVHESTGFVDWTSPLHWREDADLSGLNVMTLGIWYECIMRWVGEAKCVSAMARTVVKARRDGQGIMRAVRVPDHIEVLTDMACGAQASFHISRVTGFAGPNEAVVYGSEGTLRFSSDILEAGKRSGSMQVVNIPDALAGKWRVEEEFINAVRGSETVSLTTFTDGVKYMEFTEAVMRSANEGREITLPL